jgi:hypothetical protein
MAGQGNTFIADLAVLGLAEETTPGTAVAVASADCNIRVENVTIAGINVPMDNETSKTANGNMAESASIPGTQDISITFSVRMAWGGTGATQPKWAKLAALCGLKEKAFTTTGLGYEGLTEVVACTHSLALEYKNPGSVPVYTKLLLKGCIADVTITSGIGLPWTMNVTVQGTVTSWTTGSGLALTSPSTVVPERFLASQFVAFGITEKISAFTLTLGNQISPEYDQAEGTGISHFSITSRQPRFSYNPYKQPEASNDMYARYAVGTVGIIGLGTPSGSPHLVLDIPQAQIIGLSQEIREGRISWAVNCKCLENGTTDSNWSTEATFGLVSGVTGA